MFRNPILRNYYKLLVNTPPRLVALIVSGADKPGLGLDILKDQGWIGASACTFYKDRSGRAKAR
jgi:hypothetical protein